MLSLFFLNVVRLYRNSYRKERAVYVFVTLLVRILSINDASQRLSKIILSYSIPNLLLGSLVTALEVQLLIVLRASQSI